MKKSIFILGSIIAAAILFYPQASISLSTGSPGGKTGSPMDNSDCTSCHSVLASTVSTTNITSNIPSTGYVPGNTYNITVVHNGAGFGDPTGFEITCEENALNTKTGTFFITNSNTTQLVNNGSAVTHTTAGNSFMTWSFDWEAPLSGTGNVTFYGAFIEAGYPIGLNQGDYFSSTTLSASEFIPLLGCTDFLACNYNASASVDDSSCIYVNISVSNSNVSCNGFTDGGVVAIANGGVTPYQYSIDGATWQSSNAFSNLSAGTYFIDVTDINGCTSQEQVVISEPSPLSFSENSTNETAALNDGSITVNTNGGVSPYQYSNDGGNNWSTSNIFTGLSPGPYMIIVQDANGCTVSDGTYVNAYIATGIDNIKNSSKKLLKITDFLGRETNAKNQPLFYIYDDGTVEKRIIIE